MFGLPALRLGKIFGIPLEVDISWFFIFFLVAASLATGYLPNVLPESGYVVHVAIAVVTALGFFASIVVHELAHSLVARAGGLRISRVTLFMFGGVSQMEEEPHSPGHEFAMALAGPMTSLLLGGAGFGLLRATEGWLPTAVGAPVEYLAVINLSVAGFNLLPGFPLDGGRALRALLWAATGDMLKATRWASRCGQVIGYLLVGVAVVGVLRGTLGLIWFAVIGWFLASVAGFAYQQQLLRTRLAHIPVSRIMSAPVLTVPATTTLEEMADSYFLGGRHSRYPVVSEGHVIGLVELQTARDVPRSQWSDVSVAEVARKDLGEIVVDPQTSIEKILARLEPDGPGAVLVVEDGRLAGIVTRADVIRLLRTESL
ncbi:MAG: site-2 protease family protein [Coriobacteriales bacterium]|nr:site-2 protease family protein [Actinomycetes bacterium]